MGNLIIRAELSSPPSIASSFRDLTLYSTIKYEADCLIEIEPEFTDLYWHWMKNRGLLDFVEQFVKPFEELGVVVDTCVRRPRTIYVQRIVPENLQAIYGEVAGYLKTKTRRPG